MRRLAIALALMLAACDTPPAEPAAGMSSSAVFDPSRFVDVWHIVAEIAPGPACGPRAETWTATASGQFRVTGTICGPTGARAFLANARMTGPGRMARTFPDGRSEDLWVLWVDADYRLAVIGTPSRAFARILARRPQPSGDLLQAAHDVLRFNGYDPAMLRNP
ncbi:lipocalin [Albidovulum inexpectatum]|uniref:Lipocalin n=1 Tax=Albidovulum inexpectatum TaxID=196587 RepID=A0A2S5JI70_9RHOB|nr:lipocalin family protein [Albidovulum inexpectatum]PPB81152.1 lipocalin [Albidovulum inexpectatum]